MPEEFLADISENSTVVCSHCKDETRHPIKEDGENFCCYGCQTVYHALKEKDLLHYYKLREETGDKVEAANYEFMKEDFSFMNDEKFQAEFLHPTTNGLELKLYLEGIHCVACVWLLEKTPTFIEGVRSARVQLGLSTIELVIEPGSDLSKIAKEISNMGYRPHPVKSNDEVERLQKNEDRLKLIQIGIAAACSSNIMLYSVAIYAGAGSNFSGLFGWVSFFLSLPVIFFSAIPFYTSSIKAIKNKSVNIDVPISTAIILGSLSGLYNLAVGSDHFYFDSLAVLVFLLLSSRYFVHKLLQNGLNTKGLKSLFNQSSILRLNIETKEYESIHCDYVNKGDTLLINPGQTIPNDSKVIKGQSFVNNSLITGESKPVEISEGMTVFAGSQNLSEKVTIKVEKDFSSSSLGKIIEKVENTHSENIHLNSLTNKLSKWFVLCVFTLSISSFIYFLNQYGLNIAIERTLALIIISCPCALGLAAPLALARSMALAKSNGIIIKSESSLEDLASIKDVFLDKTGTLTKGKFDVINVDELIKLNDIKKIIYSIEKNSTHPIAQSLVNWSRETQAYEINNYIETPGVGVKATIQDKSYRLEKTENSNTGNTSVSLFVNDKLHYTFQLKDQLRENATELINYLKDNKNTITLLSGDNSACVESVASELGIERDKSLGDMAPENKAKYIKKAKKSIMVGDGANDAIAMREADVAISLRGAMDISLRASDVYLTRDPMKGLIQLFNLSKKTFFTIKTNLFISLAYNILGVVLSLFGIVTPLFAAVLMPISSVTVVIATLINLKNKQQGANR